MRFKSLNVYSIKYFFFIIILREQNKYKFLIEINILDFNMHKIKLFFLCLFILLFVCFFKNYIYNQINFFFILNSKQIVFFFLIV